MDRSFGNLTLGHPFRIEIAKRGQLLYQQGYELASELYQKTWRTENLVRNADFCICIVESKTERIVSNLGIALRQKVDLLPSERYFSPYHWRGHFSGNDGEICELSAFAIADDLPQSIKHFAIAATIVSVFDISRTVRLNWIVAIQRYLTLKYLKRLGLQPIEKYIAPNSQLLPRDRYWQGSSAPRLYYLNPLDLQAKQIIADLRCRLQLDPAQKVYENINFRRDLAQEPERLAGVGS